MNKYKMYYLKYVNICRMYYLKHEETIKKVNNMVLFIGLLLITSGLTANYQANHDASVLNESLYNIATTNHKLTDGNTYYYIGLYDTSFDAKEIINKTQCQALYGDNK